MTDLLDLFERWFPTEEALAEWLALPVEERAKQAGMDVELHETPHGTLVVLKHPLLEKKKK